MAASVPSAKLLRSSRMRVSNSRPHDLHITQSRSLPILSSSIYAIYAVYAIPRAASLSGLRLSVRLRGLRRLSRLEVFFDIPFSPDGPMLAAEDRRREIGTRRDIL